MNGDVDEMKHLLLKLQLHDSLSIFYPDLVGR